MIRVENLSFHFKKNHVLERWNLTISPGEKVVLLGSSGCGKTTFLKILGGIHHISQGTLEGVPEEIGFVFQEPRLIPWATVAENLTFIEPRVEVSQLLRQVRLTGQEGKYPHQLSGGMQQRVNLARALGRKPELLLLDEPFGSLDLRQKYAIMEEVLHFWKDHGCTVVMVTHDITEALFLGDRILLLQGPPTVITREIEVPLSLDERSPWGKTFLECRGELLRSLFGISRETV